jgi:TolB protein
MPRHAVSSHAVRAGGVAGAAGAVALAVALCVLAWTIAGSAHAASPGANGRIVYASQRADQRYQIFTMRADGSDRRPLGIGINPKYSRAGTRIAFIRGTHVFVMNVDGTGVRQLTSGAGADYNPSWSPDDRRIAFARSAGGQSDIYVVPVDGGAKPQDLTRNSPADERGPAWSPDGTRIAYERDGSIAVMRADGTSSRTLTTSGTGVSPAWSPDGRRLAFAGRASDADDWEIYVMSANGTGMRSLAPDPAIDLDPVWSPDGGSIAFTSTRGTNYDIFVMSADGTGVRQLTGASATDTTADWQSVDRGPVATGVLRVVACATVEGTGFLVAPRLVVTANHVVVDQGRVARTIVLEAGRKRVATATVVGRDPVSDLALLRTSAPVRGHVFRFLPRAVRRNEDVVVHGYPLGAGRVVRPGTVEALGQSTVADDNVRRRGLVQVAVAASEGMSGSPLVRGADPNGEAGHVVGVVIEIRERGNIAFAVPTRVAEPKLAAWRTAKALPSRRCG